MYTTFYTFYTTFYIRLLLKIIGLKIVDLEKVELLLLLMSIITIIFN